MRKYLLFSFLFLVCASGIRAQQDLNKYQFVVVPSQYSFLEEPDQYQLNSLSKFLFEKSGFETYLANEDLPREFAMDRCKGLFADVRNHSGIFRTKLEVVLKDCKGEIKFVSREGQSGAKDFKTAYHEALRDAFTSVAALNYKYEEVVATRSDVEVKTNKDSAAPEEDSRPASKKEAMKEQMPDSKMEAVKKSAVAGNRVFVLDEMVFYLEKTEKGFRFYQKGMAEPFAELISSKIPNQYIYSSISKPGVAHFDERGNLTVKVLDSSNNTIETKFYRLQAQ